MLAKRKKSQSILEYAVILSVIIAVIIAMQVYVKRAVQGRMKESADQVGDQFTAEQTYTIQTVTQSARREQTLTGQTPTGEDIDGVEVWSHSNIMDATEAGALLNAVGTDQDLGSAVDDYSGVERMVVDYVDQDVGGDDLGTHGTFESGVLRDQNVFETP